MKKYSLSYYEDKYENGFWHYFKKCSLIDELSNDGQEAIEELVQLLVPLLRFLFICVVIIGKPIAWIPLRVIEYRKCKVALSETKAAIAKAKK